MNAKEPSNAARRERGSFSCRWSKPVLDEVKDQLHYSKLFSVQLLRMRRPSEGLRKEVHRREPGNRPENLYSFDDPNASLGQDWSFIGPSSHGNYLLILPK